MSRFNTRSLKRATGLPYAVLHLSGLVLIVGAALSLGDASAVSPWLRIIVGLLVFLLPGGYLFGLIPARDSWDLVDVLGYGFAFSMALVTVLGLITRTLALSIDAVELVWYLLALLGFAALYRRIAESNEVTLNIRAPEIAILAVVIVLVAILAHSSLFAAPTTDDQNRHHAAVNGFLRDEPLGWAEPYYETGNSIADRMYLTYWVLAQALIVEISGAPILLARYFINPFAMLMTVVGMYIFARNLQHGRKASLVYVVLGLLAYSLITDIGPQAGSQFFVRALLDKVLAAFTLAPIAISSAYQYAVSRRRRALFAFGLTMFAAVFVHSILGGFAAVIIGVWCLIRLIMEADGRKNAVHIGLLTVLILSPAILLRLSTAEKTIYNFSEVPDDDGNKIYVFDAINPLDDGNKFYAIHSASAGDITYVLVTLSLLAVLARRLDSRSKLMLAYVIALGIGLLPYTAWIYGRLVSIGHVYRVLWLVPYGYIMGYIFDTGFMVLVGRRPDLRPMLRRLGYDRILVSLAVLAFLITLHFLHASGRLGLNRDIASASNPEREWLDIGDYIDANHDVRVWVAASMESRNLAITLNWKVIGLSRFTPERMSYYSNLPLEQTEMQRNDNDLLFRADVSVEQKLSIIDRYGIDYLLFPKGYAWMVDALYQTDNDCDSNSCTRVRHFIWSGCIESMQSKLSFLINNSTVRAIYRQSSSDQNAIADNAGNAVGLYITTQLQ